MGMGRDVCDKTVIINNDCTHLFHQYAHMDLFIGIITHDYYNIRTAPVYLS
jgi:hypothetical protein